MKKFHVLIKVLCAILIIGILTNSIYVRKVQAIAIPIPVFIVVGVLVVGYCASIGNLKVYIKMVS